MGSWMEFPLHSKITLTKVTNSKNEIINCNTNAIILREASLDEYLNEYKEARYLMDEESLKEAYFYELEVD